jgi:hypothetical protein
MSQPENGDAPPELPYPADLCDSDYTQTLTIEELRAVLEKVENAEQREELVRSPQN